MILRDFLSFSFGFALSRVVYVGVTQEHLKRPKTPFQMYFELKCTFDPSKRSGPLSRLFFFLRKRNVCLLIWNLIRVCPFTM